jgi:endonuclease YncB( thermonuclease family)
LDADGDGRACDSLPCPCSSSTGSGGSSGGGSGGKQLKQRARVISVTDGDTIKVRLLPNGPRHDVRLIGIDTPEVYGGVECGGRAASRSLKRLLPQDTIVRMLSDTSQDRVDRYGRIPRYVHQASTDKDVNRVQVARGWARVYVCDGNPFRRVEGYRTAQANAKQAERGIWGSC